MNFQRPKNKSLGKTNKLEIKLKIIIYLKCQNILQW